MSQRNRLAFVTGTSSGIGAVLAKALLEEEWMVVGMARRQVAIDDPRYRHIQSDLGDLPRLEALAAEQLTPLLSESGWRRVGLVNNAAMIGALRGLEHIAPSDLSRVFAVNAIAPMYLMGCVVREAPTSASLRIVNISTGAAVHPFPGLSDYGSSKSALRMAGMILAEEMSSGERPGGPRGDAAILSYEPGVVETDMQVQARSAKEEAFPWNQPFKDFAARGMLEKPEDVVTDVVEFLSRDSNTPFEERRYGTS